MTVTPSALCAWRHPPAARPHTRRAPLAGQGGVALTPLHHATVSASRRRWVGRPRHRAAAVVSWILFGLSIVAAAATCNALWPIRRPWWLKLASFNAGYLANELPLHVLAGQATLVGVLASMGALDERPGQVGLALSAAAAVGLVVLAAAHRRARAVVDEAVRPSLGSDGGFGTDWTARRPGWPFPTSWLVLPGMAWFRSARRHPCRRRRVRHGRRARPAARRLPARRTTGRVVRCWSRSTVAGGSPAIAVWKRVR